MDDQTQPPFPVVTTQQQDEPTIANGSHMFSFSIRALLALLLASALVTGLFVFRQDADYRKEFLSICTAAFFTYFGQNTKK